MPFPADHPEPTGREEADRTAEVVEGELVEERRRRLRQQRSPRLDVEFQESRYASPLPAPEDLERYARLLPNAPERLLAAGEREQAHRHEIESRLAAIDEQAMPRFYAGQKRAHIIGLVLGLVYLGIMGAAILSGHEIVGIGGAAAGLAAVVWALRREPSGSASDDPPPPPQDDEAPPPS